MINLSKLKPGMRFWHNDVGEDYILAQPYSYEYCLISLKNGNRYSNPTENISEVFDGDEDDFTLIES